MMNEKSGEAKMLLRADFHFSQSSLQDYETCPRRFQLRYLRRLDWPAVESEPVQEAERLAQLGADFHRLVHQHLLGLDGDILARTVAAGQPELQVWWQNYLAHRPLALAGAELRPELTLSTPLRGYRLLARFDLLAIGGDGSFLIVDWKTAQRKPDRENLARQMQTRVYPYVLAKAGAAYNQGRPVEPAAIRMLYWYPAALERPEEFEYSPALFRRDEQYLSELIERIKAAAENEEFPLVKDSKPCTYCVYRSYCDRGKRAGPLVEQTEEPPATLDVSDLGWDQIAEIQF
jgi:CRISPR/Cas system-associated exonuclease Cas4 (RecB family)